MKHGLPLNWGLAIQGDAVDVIKKSARQDYRGPEYNRQSGGFKITKDKARVERNQQVPLMRTSKLHDFDMVIRKNLRQSGSS